MKAAAAPVGQPWLWDAGLWPPRRPHADLRLRADARGCDGGVRQELAAGVVQLKPASFADALPPSVEERSYNGHHRSDRF